MIAVVAGGAEPSGDSAMATGQALLLRAITEAGSLPLLRAMIEKLTMGHFVSCSTEDWCRLLARFEMAELLPIVHCLCEPQAQVPRDLVFALLQGLLKSSPEGLSQVGCGLATKAAQLAPQEVNVWARSHSQFSTDR
jgi:hypothetical protein